MPKKPKKPRTGKKKAFTYLLKKHKITQQQFADLLGISKSSVSEWARGIAVPHIDPKKTQAALRILRCTFDEWVDLFEPYLSGSDRQEAE